MMNHRRHSNSFGLVLVASLFCFMPLLGQNHDDGELVASVGDFQITNGAVDRLLEKSLPNFDLARTDSTMIAAAVEKLIDQYVVYDYLVFNNRGAGKNEIALAREAFQAEISKFEQTWDGYLNAQKLTSEALEFEFAWSISWNRFLKKELTEDYLRQYFIKHQREFDDSEMKVAHLLIRSTENLTLAMAQTKAQQVLAELKSGELSWDDAVRDHSSAPTRESGGELGWIRYEEPMPTEFSVVAFQLNVAETSQPVTTVFGVHLIKCLEIRDGKTGWRDALDRLRESATRDLFIRLAAQHRPQVKIKYPAK